MVAKGTMLGSKAGNRVGNKEATWGETVVVVVVVVKVRCGGDHTSNSACCDYAALVRPIVACVGPKTHLVCRDNLEIRRYARRHWCRTLPPPLGDSCSRMFIRVNSPI